MRDRPSINFADFELRGKTSPKIRQNVNFVKVLPGLGRIFTSFAEYEKHRVQDYEYEKRRNVDYQTQHQTQHENAPLAQAGLGKGWVLWHYDLVLTIFARI